MFSLSVVVVVVAKKANLKQKKRHRILNIFTIHVSNADI